MIMANCPICDRKILAHAKKISCTICYSTHHLKCISIDPEVTSKLELEHKTWYCSVCLADVFPYNHIESNDEFFSSITPFNSLLNNLSEKLFLPFELNEPDHLIGAYNEDVDPDIHFFNTFNQHLAKCNYLTDESFTRLMHKSTLKEQSFSLCHLNIRSIRKNLGAFESFIDTLQYEFPIIGLTETWLSDHDNDLYNITGFNMIENHRSEKSGGGVAICVKESIDYNSRADLGIFNDLVESIYIEIDRSQFNSEKNIVIGTIYRKPDSDICKFVEMLSVILDKLSKENKLVYLLGDYNLNLLNAESHSLTSEFIEMMYSHHFFPLISRPTRITQNSATLIDNIFTNNVCDVESSLNGILVTDISDHFLVFHINYKYTANDTESYFLTRVYSQKNKQIYKEKMSSLNWNDVVNEYQTQVSFDIFHDKLRAIHDECFPKIKIKKGYSNRKPWLTDSLKKSIKLKNKLYHLSKKIPCVRTESHYKSYKTTLNRLLKKAEKSFYNDLLINNKHNMRKSWSIIKTVIGKYKQSNCQKRFKLNDDSITDDKNIISEKFNDFFINVGPNLAKNIPKMNKNPLYCMPNSILESMFVEPVTSEEIKKLVMNLKKSASGWDDISTKFLKLSLEYIITPLTHLCNRSLQEGVFPEQLKIANVIPLYKSEDPMKFNNYRPVSLLCILSKVFEKIMYTRLLKFLNKLQIIYKNQFGFRKHHSTYMALMLLIDKITKSLDKGEFVVGVFLDFSKAFDTVNHEILLKKMEHYGIRGHVLSWFKSYLSSRSQFVTYNGVKSTQKNITCGVPQGSILGPLLFLLYINDLSKVCESMMPLLFADDTNLFKSGKDCDKIQNEIEHDLLKISEWLKINKLSLNIKKKLNSWFSLVKMSKLI